LIGETVREFEIVSELGAGGYGVVYLARDTTVDRDVAIKVILPQYANQPEFIANFEAEARLVAQLEHKDIVPLYSYWHDEQGAFLVMRYIRGGSLRGMIAKQGALPLNIIMRIVEQIAEALNVAHEAGVVHRDLKPDNILIDERGNAYLTDFGIAKQVAEDKRSATDAIKGTFAYLSPEQIEQTTVSPQTDVYAFGVMLYEMLAGQHPYHDTPVGMMIMKHLQEALPDIRDVRDNLSPQISNIIARATAKDPADRYSSTLDLLSDLKFAIDGQALPEVPVVQPPPKKKPTTSEERNRHAMLENVRTFWVEGVLENSLHGAAMIDLGMKAESGAVDNPWDTLLRTPAGEEQRVSGSIVEQFDRLNGKLLILGDPGSGKTTTLLTLARDLLIRAEMDDQHPIPVVLNLSSWSETQAPLAEWIVEELNGKYQVPRKVGQRWIAEDELLLLLDGLDEVAEEVRSACVTVINDYRGQHGFVDMVVCSRIKDYDTLTAQLKLNGAIVIQPLDEEQIVQYLNALGTDVAVVRELITRDAQLRELAHSPLMLSIMVLAYRGKSSDDVPDFDDIDAQRNNLFEVYVDRMFERRVGQMPYTKPETLHYLRWLARQMTDNIASVFHIEDLQPNWLASKDRSKSFPRDIKVFSGIHLAITWSIAWFVLHLISEAPNDASILISTIVGTACGALYGGMMSDRRLLLGDNRTRWATLILIAPFTIPLPLVTIALIVHGWDILPLAIIILLFGGFANVNLHSLALKKLGTLPDRIVFFETIRFYAPRLRPSMLLDLVFFILLAPIFLFMFFPSQFMVNIQMVIISLIFGGTLTFAFSYAFTGFTNGDVSLRIRPNQGFSITLRLMIRFVLYVGLFASLIPVALFLLGVTLPNTLGAIVGSTFLLAIGDTVLSNGGIPLMQHMWLRYQLEREGNIPRHLADFLDHASDLILMRKVGGGYIFIHRYLLEYFAELDNEDK